MAIYEGHVLSKFLVCGQEAAAIAVSKKIYDLAVSLNGDDWGVKILKGESLDFAVGQNDFVVKAQTFEFDSPAEKTNFLDAAAALVRREAPDGSNVRVRFVNPELPMVVPVPMKALG